MFLKGFISSISSYEELESPSSYEIDYEDSTFFSSFFGWGVSSFLIF